jgi:hypothetical protein
MIKLIKFIYGQRKYSAMLIFVVLSGCQIPHQEYENFKAMPEDQRAIKKVKLTWIVRPDVTEYCSQANIVKNKGMMSTSIACAIWSENTQTCTIVTSPNPNHVVLGHEVRHCFEGHFHM